MTAVWLDADPGFDDWMTMLMLAHAHAQGDIQWVGTSIVHGNAPLTTTFANALAIFSRYRLPGTLFRGHAQSLDGPQITAQSILGIDGMRTKGTALRDIQRQAHHEADTETDNEQDTNLAIQTLVSTVEQHANDVTLIATGPLTNIAHALIKQPRIAKQIKQLVLMGGSTDRGNHTAAAEFNIFADPKAASIVFESGVNIAMFGLNLCRQVLLTQDDVLRFMKIDSQEAKCFSGYLDGYQRIRRQDASVAMPLYDPVVAAYVLAPALFEMQDARVNIELQGEFTRGMTVCDFKQAANAEVAMRCDADKVRKLIFDSVENYLLKL
jgi:purine nucleosidase